eukprot:COSAG01_NODE_39702_length_473_cov_0.689840_1_plen_41_part_10
MHNSGQQERTNHVRMGAHGNRSPAPEPVLPFHAWVPLRVIG